MTDNKVIYSMIRVGKVIPPNREVLKDISISYFYGAKIGVIGANGSGKSTLLRIMAGVDTNFNGQTTMSPCASPAPTGVATRPCGRQTGFCRPAARERCRPSRAPRVD